ncbi:phosphotransferase [Deinococcus sp. HMF7620]|uniref:Phosphotransferase n=1 Tax=Deinococcus arboris TaxID=2682977 RepID=A0A7C9M1F8_9DEIO|nr:phosphotransferase [Deinococcus arboris]MVN86642.1 phosphotransferase [Deinococcus arboris]
MKSLTKNTQTHAQIERLVAHAFPETGIADDEQAVLELKEGWFNAAYQIRLRGGRQVVLKIAPPPGADVMQYERHIMFTEVAAMRRVRAVPGIPVPEIYAFDDSLTLCDAPYFFMAHVEGQTLDQLEDTLSAAELAALHRKTGAVIRAVNQIEGPYFGYDGNPALRADTWREAFTRIFEAVLEDAERKGFAYDFTPDELRAALNRHASALEEVTAPRLVHWDAWNPNFFARDGEIVGLIDFERALWAEPLMEAQFRPLFGEGVTPPMEGYGQTTFTPAEEQRMHLYTLHLALVMHTECAYRQYDTDEIFNFSRDLIRREMAWLTAD